MGVPTHQWALEKHFDELVEEKPEIVSTVVLVRKKLCEGNFYPGLLVDACFQNFRDMKPSLAEAYCFGRIWAHYVSGEVCIFEVPVKSGPFSDKNTEANQGVLNELPEEFEARFFGGPGDNDGWFRLREEIGLTQVFAQPDGSEKRERWWCPPCQLPLEVGYTTVSKTFEHIHGEYGVARWPYGRDVIVALVTHPSLRDRKTAAYNDAVKKHLEKKAETPLEVSPKEPP